MSLVKEPSRQVVVGGFDCLTISDVGDVTADRGRHTVGRLLLSRSYATSILISLSFTASTLGSRTVRTPSR